MTRDERVDALVVGDLNPDLLVSGEDLAPRPGQVERDAELRLVLGGSAGIAAAGMARLGLRTAICATVGDDDVGAAARRMLAEHGVWSAAVRTVPGRRTGLSVHLLAGAGRTIWTDRGAIAELTSADTIDAIARLRPRHVHLGGVYLLPALTRDGGAILAAGHVAGATVSADTNFDPTGRFERPAWLTRADLLLPNAAEALRLTGHAPGAGDGDPAAAAAAEELAGDGALVATDAAVEAAAGELAGDGALVAVKRGARGALAVRRGGEHVAISLPAALVPFADAVGAGDSFDAGMVRALLDGRPLREALAYACAAGTLSTRAAGGTAAQATHDEADALAKELLR